MFSRSSNSLPSPTRGNSIIVIPIEWPVTWPSVKPRSRNALRDGRVDVVRGGAGRHRRARGLDVLVVGVHRRERVRARLAGAERARELDPVAAERGDLETVEEQVVLLDPARVRSGA